MFEKLKAAAEAEEAAAVATVGHAPADVAHVVDNTPADAHVVPIAVSIAGTVATREKGAGSWTTVNTPIPAGATLQLVGWQPDRRDITLTTTGSGTVWVAPTAQAATPSTGFPLPDTGALTLQTTAPVFVHVESTDVDSSVAAVLQYEDGGR